MGIETFKTHINNGLARPNRFEVSISRGAAGSEFIKFTCEQAEVPGVQFATNEDLLFGPVRKMPFLPVFNDMALVFMCKEDMTERSFFDDWINAIYDKSGKIGQNFMMEYYVKYVATMTITKLDQKNVPVYTVNCIEAYPLEVISQQLSFGETDTYLKLEVRMAFRYWERV